MKITDIIKYEGDNSTFIWKHPCEDFNSLTQLIVHESQEAIFFMNGQALDLFGPGRYTLNSQNIPILGKLITKATDGESPFHCEVYFINKTVQMAVKWGTDSRVRFIDPLTQVPLDIGACGEMNLQVCDSRKLLVKLVGTMNGIAWQNSTAQDKDNFTKSLVQCFRPLISTAVKANLANAIVQNNLDILEIDLHLEEYSELLRQKIASGFEEYGLTIPQLYVTNFSLPDPDKDVNFRQIRDLRSLGLKEKVIDAEAQLRTAHVQAEAKVDVAKQEAEAQVKAAERQAILEGEANKTEMAKAQAERDMIQAQVEAQKTRLSGMAEAEVMAAKGYNEKDVMQKDVQIAFAQGMGQMGSKGGSAGGGMMGDMIGLGVGLQAANAMSGQLGGIFAGFAGNNAQTPAAAPVAPAAEAQAEIKCASCGNSLPANAKFCLECGTKVEILAENEMICPECGKKTPKGKFCMECGAALIRKCASCGAEIPTGAKFCLECGEKL